MMWLYALVSENHAMSTLVVKNDGLRQTVMGWVMDADSPQVQRVAMRLLASILRRSGSAASIVAILRGRLASASNPQRHCPAALSP